MILKEPNTVNLRPSAPTSNTVNIVLMLTSVLGYILLCSMKAAHYGDRGGGLGVGDLCDCWRPSWRVACGCADVAWRGAARGEADARLTSRGGTQGW